MTLEEFKEKANSIIEEFQDLIDELPQKGNTSEDCQKVCLQQHLNELDSAVTGTEASDLKTNTHYCESCGWEGMEDDLNTTTDLSQREVQYGKCCPDCQSEDIEEI